MFDIKAVLSDPCQTCSVMALILLLVSTTQVLQDFEKIDLFGFRSQFGHVPPVLDLAGAAAFAIGLWVLCERVVVGKLLGGCDRAKRRAGSAGTDPEPP